MANVKLSQIASGGQIAGATDVVVGVRSGTTDYLFTPVTLDLPQQWTAVQTYGVGMLSLLGSSTGHTLFESANASASNYTIMVPAISDTLVTLMATQTLSNKTIISNSAVRCTTELDKTTDTTLANLVGLVQTVVAGTYNYKINIQGTSGASGGMKLGFKLTTAVLSAHNAGYQAYTASGVSAANAASLTADQAIIMGVTAAVINAEISGSFVVTTGGTMQLQFAQNASNGTASSVYVGSTMSFTRIA